MRATMDLFLKRWSTVISETLSSVRRQLEYGIFDISVVNRDFRSSSSEWFDGKLAPYMWYKQLEEERPEIARKFKIYIMNIRIREHNKSKPSQVGHYVITVLSLVLSLSISYCFLDRITDMGLVSKAAFSIGTAVLAWYTCQSLFKNKNTNFDEQVVDFYRRQLEEHLIEIKKILS